MTSASERAGMSEGFSAFPAAAAASLRASATHRCWTNGSVVLSRGHVVPWVMTILRGRLRITAAAEEGHEVFFRWQLPGEIVGLASAVSGLPFPVDAVAFDDCETLEVSSDALLALMQADAQVACAAARLLARHAYDLIHLATIRTEQTLTARVLGVLRHLALLNGRPQNAASWKLAISQQDIASAVGASRPRVNAELSALERAGLIELGYRHVVVLGIPSSGAAPAPTGKR